MASKFMLKRDHAGNSFFSRYHDEEELRELMSDAESSIVSLTMTTAGDGLSDFNETFERASFPTNGYSNNMSLKLRCSKTANVDGGEGTPTVDLPNTWIYYQDEYQRLKVALMSVYAAFNDVILSKVEFDNKGTEFLKIEEYISKEFMIPFKDYQDDNPYMEEGASTYNEGFDVLQYKLWKKHYCTLLDAFVIVYKDCQLLAKIKDDKNELEKLRAFCLQRSAIEEFKLTFGAFLFKCDIGNIIQESNDGYKVSVAFLVDLVYQCRIFGEELDRQNTVKERLFHILETAKEQRSKLKIYVSNLRGELGSLLSKMKVVHRNEPEISSCNKLGKVESLSVLQKQEYQNHIEGLERILKEEETRRKKLHNKLQELIGNIRVYCRIRPQPNSFLKTTLEDKIIVMGDCLSEKITKHWYGKESKCFIFDRVFAHKIDQVGVFESVEELILSCVDGYNVCIMAYGQTGSGKTHTMMGTVVDPGVNRRAIKNLLCVCESRVQWKYHIFLSMVEIYQEDVRDLLSEKQAPSVRIMSTQDNEIMLHGLSEHEVKCENDIFRYFDVGERNRKVASTLLNITSSRSHLIVLLKVHGENRIYLTRSVGTLTLCDLAGSENITKSGATGERFSEATCINKSLTTLGRVFDSLRKQQKPSYRETKLTYLLKPTLGGDSKCLLFINVRCEPENAEESLRALHFGVNAMQVAPEKAQQRSKIRKTLGKISI